MIIIKGSESEENWENYRCRYIVHDHALRWLLYQGRYMFRVGHALAQCPLWLHLKHTPLLSPVALTKVPPRAEELDCAPRLPPLDLELPELELLTVLEALTVVVFVVDRPLRPPPRPLPCPRACPLCVRTGSGSGAWAPGASSHLKKTPTWKGQSLLYMIRILTTLEWLLSTSHTIWWNSPLSIYEYHSTSKWL